VLKTLREEDEEEEEDKQEEHKEEEPVEEEKPPEDKDKDPQTILDEIFDNVYIYFNW